jgi:ATP-dependent RNA helicase HelY
MSVADHPAACGLAARFFSSLPFVPDEYQRRAVAALERGHSVLVSAPTGSGKTVVADFAVFQALESSRKAFYTTPLKALSNQKHDELSRRYGAERVGLLTGDVSHQPDAPVVVMTTEVLRNMLFEGSELLDGLGAVVLDEVHYLEDPTRGSVWEEVVVLLPPEVLLVSLSATVSNAETLGAWIRAVHGPTEVVTASERPVALFHHVAVATRRARDVELVGLLEDGRLAPAARRLQANARSARQARRAETSWRRFATPRRLELIEELSRRAMLPAIVFIFSRAGCEQAAWACVEEGLRLTTPTERREIRRRLEARTEGLPGDELRVLGYGRWLATLEAGVAAHHAGMIPAFREAVEECFEAGLIKVVFATETLSLGINMPARTVVVERLTKVRDHGRSALTSGEYAQLTGRAGRRGLDEVGHAVVPWSLSVDLEDLARLATSPAPEIRSSFRPGYNLALNVVRRYPPTRATEILERSLAQFLDGRHRHALTRRLERSLALLEQLGYVSRAAWRLEAKGELLARLYHEADLLVAEALARGIFEGLDAAELAAVASGASFEARPGRASRRRHGPRRPPSRRAAGARTLIPQRVVERMARLEQLGEELRALEHDAGLPRSRPVDGGFAEAAWRWARGSRLEVVLETSGLAPGDFVRNVRQLVDLLRQLGQHAPSTEVQARARQAATALERGVAAPWAGPGLFGDQIEAEAGA